MIHVAVIGATGYAGAELARRLDRHPEVSVTGLFASEQSPTQPLAGRRDLTVDPLDLKRLTAGGTDLVFLATPHQVSRTLVPPLLDAGMRVLDLSGAFRLQDQAQCARWYGDEAMHPDLLTAAAYGLPELNRESIRNATLIAVPGCYPTSAILPIRPLVASGVVRSKSPIIINSVSGVSGAGRAASLRTHFCEVSLQPYGVDGHRHRPEIEAYVGAPVIFTPHLAAFERGILSTIHLSLEDGIDTSAVRSALDTAYQDEPFIHHLPEGEWPALASVCQTNVCEIGLHVDDTRRHLVVVSAIDNLIKGAAGQALQCMNILHGIPETTGLAA